MEGLGLGLKLPSAPVWLCAWGHAEHTRVFLSSRNSLAAVFSDLIFLGPPEFKRSATSVVLGDISLCRLNI